MTIVSKIKIKYPEDYFDALKMDLAKKLSEAAEAAEAVKVEYIPPEIETCHCGCVYFRQEQVGTLQKYVPENSGGVRLFAKRTKYVYRCVECGKAL